MPLSTSQALSDILGMICGCALSLSALEEMLEKVLRLWYLDGRRQTVLPKPFAPKAKLSGGLRNASLRLRTTAVHQALH